MKANEAPETYPIQFRDKIDEYLWKEHHILGGCCSSIESMKYSVAREVAERLTDAFIEKACDWLRKCLDNGLWVANDVGETEKEAIIEHFKEAIMFMKVEKTCDFCKHLTWEDIKLIWTIGDEIPYMPEEDFFKELLKRFKAQKGE